MKIKIISFIIIFLFLCGCKVKVEVSPQEIPEPKIEIPQMTIIKTFYSYTAIGKRDPFWPLIQKKLEKPEKPKAPIAQPKPIKEIEEETKEVFIKQLSLRGIIWDGDEKVALLCDGGGFGYILKGGKLLGQNFQALPGIYGIALKDKVILYQMGQRVELTLAEKKEEIFK